MAGYKVRSLVELSQAARKYFTQSLDGAVASVWANTFTVLAKVLALCGQGLELRRAWLVKQIFASTADRLWLTRHGFELGLQPYPAIGALGSATFPATAGVVVPAGLQFARADGVTFTSIAQETAAGATVSLSVAADSAGALTNTAAGSGLTLVNPDDAPDGFIGIGTVDAEADGSGLSGGVDAEEIEAFRARVLERKRNVPQGGSEPDYVTWVREALGADVVAVYVDSFQNDARSVWVAFTVKDQPSGIPSDAQVALVQAYIDDPIRRPVTARVFAIKLIPSPVPVLIGGLSPDTPAIRAAIAVEVAAVFADRAVPGTPSAPFVLSASWIDEAISRATGENRHRLVSPAADPSFDPGTIPVFAAPTYTD